MRYYEKTFVVLLIVLYLGSLVGCATPPKKEEISEKDMLIQNLTEENVVLREEIDRLTKENEALMQEKLQLEAEREALKEIK